MANPYTIDMRERKHSDPRALFNSCGRERFLATLFRRTRYTRPRQGEHEISSDRTLCMTKGTKARAVHPGRGLLGVQEEKASPASPDARAWLGHPRTGESFSEGKKYRL